MSPCSLNVCVNDFPSLLVSTEGVSTLTFSTTSSFTSALTSLSVSDVSVVLSVAMSPCSLRDSVNDFPLLVGSWVFVVSVLVASAFLASACFFASSTAFSTFSFVSPIFASISGFAFSTASIIFCPCTSPCSLRNSVNDFPLLVGSWVFVVSVLVASAFLASACFFASSTAFSTFSFVSPIFASISGFAFSTASIIFCPCTSPCSLKCSVNDFLGVSVSSLEGSVSSFTVFSSVFSLASTFSSVSTAVSSAVAFSDTVSSTGVSSVISTSS